METIVINPNTGLRFGEHTSNIGPAHDPYGQTKQQLSLPDGTKATYLTNGLGMHTVTFTSDHNGVVREFRCVDDKPEFLPEVDAICRQLFGTTFDEAYHKYLNDWEPDPMGSLSRYI